MLHADVLGGLRFIKRIHARIFDPWDWSFYPEQEMYDAFEREYREYGYTFGTARDRLRALAAALPLIKERWQAELPAPVRNPIPICIGGEGEQITLKLAAQHADMWNGFGPIDNFKHKNAVLDRWCAELGRDPKTIERSILTGTHAARGLDRLVEAGASHIIVTLRDPWNFAVLKQLVRWRDARR